MAKTKELKIAIETAKKAGDFLQINHGQRQTFTRKVTSSKLSSDTRKGFQTKQDIEAEKIILMNLKKEFSDHGFLTEESQSKDTDRKYVWVIDPLEGTIAYMHGLENYGTAIALLYKKEIVLGVVYCPALSYLFWAEKGMGAFLNENRIKVSDTEKIEDSLISVEHKIFRLAENYPKVTSDLVKKIRRLRVGESCGQELSYVASGKSDALIKARQPIYDYAAGKIILEEAGGKFTDFEGNEVKISLDPEVGIGFVASNGKIHQELLKYFKK
ncbi:inositol monophosphatase [Candidatus Gottesmanbacteria bacterium]|nr:inositol monophosphatase [Candidatus Gottesmanbacteria bacterium]